MSLAKITNNRKDKYAFILLNTFIMWQCMREKKTFLSSEKYISVNYLRIKYVNIQTYMYNHIF